MLNGTKSFEKSQVRLMQENVSFFGVDELDLHPGGLNELGSTVSNWQLACGLLRQGICAKRIARVRPALPL